MWLPGKLRITSAGGKCLYLLGHLTDLIYANLKRENRGLKAIHPKLTRVEQTWFRGKVSTQVGDVLLLSLDDEHSGSHYIISLHVCKSERVYNICTFKNILLTTTLLTHTYFSTMSRGYSSPFMIVPQYQYVSQFCLLVGSIYRLAFFWQSGRGHKSFKWMFSLINPGTARINLSTILKRTHCCTFTTVWQNAWQFILVEERLFLFHNFWKFQSNMGEGTVWFRATEAI